MNNVYLYLLGRQLNQRVAQRFNGTVHITFHDDIQFVEVAQCQTAAHFIQRQHLLCTQTLLTLQLFALVGNFTCFLFCLDYMECIACSRCTVQAENQSRFRRTCLFHALVTFVEHGFHLTVTCTCEHNVTHLQSTVGYQHRSHIATTLIQ